MSKHTPGPWTFSCGTIRNLHGHLVADFHSTDADGLLLAAAPELLAALEALVAVQYSGNPGPAFAQARAAIAKVQS